MATNLLDLGRQVDRSAVIGHLDAVWLVLGREEDPVVLQRHPLPPTTPTTIVAVRPGHVSSLGDESPSTRNHFSPTPSLYAGPSQPDSLCRTRSFPALPVLTAARWRPWTQNPVLSYPDFDAKWSPTVILRSSVLTCSPSGSALASHHLKALIAWQVTRGQRQRRPLPILPCL
jgi:hypothetical protein